ncbi:MAG TPA: hypothetical protein VGC30_01925 [Dokdonella sp.]
MQIRVVVGKRSAARPRPHGDEATLQRVGKLLANGVGPRSIAVVARRETVASTPGASTPVPATAVVVAPTRTGTTPALASIGPSSSPSGHGAGGDARGHDAARGVRPHPRALAAAVISQ